MFEDVFPGNTEMARRMRARLEPIDPAELVTTIAALAKRFVPKGPDDEGDSP
jgi:hypothetical protein